MNLNTLMRQMDEAAQEMVPSDLKAKGWKYQDFYGKFTPKAWDYLLAWVGKDQYQLLISSEGFGKDGLPWIRGQFFISPQGFDNLRDRDRGLRIKEEMHL